MVARARNGRFVSTRRRGKGFFGDLYKSGKANLFKAVRAAPVRKYVNQGVHYAARAAAPFIERFIANQLGITPKGKQPSGSTSRKPVIAIMPSTSTGRRKPVMAIMPPTGEPGAQIEGHGFRVGRGRRRRGRGLFGNIASDLARYVPF